MKRRGIRMKLSSKIYKFGLNNLKNGKNASVVKD
jgi:hypothetical protein